MIYDLLIAMDGFLQGFSLFVTVYFVGLFLSRIGSLLEKLFISNHDEETKWWKIERDPYKDFLVAEQQDEKLSILVSQANIYRSLIGLFFTLLVIYLIETFLPYSFRGTYVIIAFILISVVLFYLSWRKQQDYIRKRIKRAGQVSNLGE